VGCLPTRFERGFCGDGLHSADYPPSPLGFGLVIIGII
jgi:hypothetical protein